VVLFQKIQKNKYAVIFLRHLDIYWLYYTI
jgi:hypothetical protein